MRYLILAFFTLVSTGRTHLQDSKALETSWQVWTQEDLLSIDEDQVWEHLNKQIHTSPWDLMGYSSEC